MDSPSLGSKARRRAAAKQSELASLFSFPSPSSCRFAWSAPERPGNGLVGYRPVMRSTSADNWQAARARDTQNWTAKRRQPAQYPFAAQTSLLLLKTRQDGLHKDQALPRETPGAHNDWRVCTLWGGRCCMEPRLNSLAPASPLVISHRADLSDRPATVPLAHTSVSTSDRKTYTSGPSASCPRRGRWGSESALRQGESAFERSTFGLPKQQLRSRPWQIIKQAMTHR